MSNKILNYFILFFTLTNFTQISLASDNFAKNNSEIIKLLKGKSIDVIAPASGTTKKLMSELENIKEIQLNIPKNCFSSPTTFHSGNDQIRFNCFKEALFNNTPILWVLRGGYGSAKIISELRKLPKPSKEKFFIGYSDNTALHLFLTQEWGWRTIHGAGMVEILSPDKDKANFIKIAKIVSGKTNTATISGLVPINKAAKNTKILNSSVTGGNLTIIQTSIGTDWQIKPKGKIIFLEDVGIKPYQVDRGLLHLNQAGIFKEIKAIIFGDVDDNNKEIITTLVNFAESVNIPVFKCERFGHRKINDPIIYNTNSTLSKSGSNYNLVMIR